MSDTSNDRTVVDGENQPLDGEKTFTQEDVNRIVGERLAKERSKREADLLKREQELQHKEFLLIAKSKLQGKGLPLELVEALNTSSPEAFDKSLEIMEQQFKQKTTQPSPEALGGSGSPGNFPRRSYSSTQQDTLRVVMGLDQGV